MKEKLELWSDVLRQMQELLATMHTGNIAHRRAQLEGMTSMLREAVLAAYEEK